MSRLSQHLRSNAIAYLALFVALGGTSYAAINLPAGSVGANQIRNHSIGPVKFDQKQIAASIRAWVIVQWRGPGLVAQASSSPVHVVTVDDGEGITWPHKRFPQNCMASVTPQVNFSTPALANGYVTVHFQPAGGSLFLQGFGPDGSRRAQAAFVMIVCP
jgi:hypothetical protein